MNGTFLLERKWRGKLVLQAVRAPACARARYASSAEWRACQLVLRQDYDRRPPYARGTAWHDVQPLMLSYALLHRSDRYTQGFLYISLPIMLALSPALWLGATTEVAGALRVYGPAAGQIHGFAAHQRQAARTVAALAQQLLRKRGAARAARRVGRVALLRAFKDMLCLRWFFIMFGQSVRTPASVLAVWDFCLHDLVYGHQERLWRLAAYFIADWATHAARWDGGDECAEQALSGMFEHTWGDRGLARVLHAARH